MEIPTEDLAISAHNPIPPGGQHVGTSNGVKVEHLPTGTIVIVQLYRSQHQNKKLAVKMIEAGLKEAKHGT